MLVTFLQANIEETSGGTYDWKFSKQAIIDIVKEGHTKDRWGALSSFRMPVLVVRGENSHVLSRDVFERMKQANIHVRGVEIAEAGHWVHYEKYEEFTRVLLEFLQSLNLHDA